MMRVCTNIVPRQVGAVPHDTIVPGNLGPPQTPIDFLCYHEAGHPKRSGALVGRAVHHQGDNYVGPGRLVDDHAGRRSGGPACDSDNMRHANLANKRFAARLEVNVKRQAFYIERALRAQWAAPVPNRNETLTRKCREVVQNRDQPLKQSDGNVPTPSAETYPIQQVPQYREVSAAAYRRCQPESLACCNITGASHDNTSAKNATNAFGAPR